MARSRSRRHRERSKRFWAGLFKLVVFLGFVGAIGYYAYETGMQLSAREVSSLKAEIADLSAAAQRHQEEAEQLRAALTTAKERAEDYRQRYEAVAPEDVRAIIAQAKAKMEEGLSAERLAFVISQAQEPRDCSPADTRRFIARTENYDGANTWVRFDNIITVTGRGAAARGGTAEWFDPAQPVTVTFSPLGGKAQEVSGRLPLQHAMIFKGREYRFTVAPGQRGFMEVTADWCEYTG